ncbi:exopolysaccharide biosynthesis polyprenyl glycosylphosphotransferase [Methylobacterium sp. NEAU 140]|uniref:exopolysaccharide biosynthesis polyprenyl glycosylphosphotransferase n=1 Tax=Methylobacterium sp. NEAU 140 TaxID=3064945 RepID=UPI0027367050|nr:exopolysaccharide biosynthesis polyprenyl glycosylphosphotransferase [Methylobacterium sp. NEAU 140]MDP4023738.1 exopolysaccharide biosynthesis polyprenyl glycosylphosphotransferase [Methylobacterium sp. NEAU 140]
MTQELTAPHPIVVFSNTSRTISYDHLGLCAMALDIATLMLGGALCLGLAGPDGAVPDATVVQISAMSVLGSVLLIGMVAAGFYRPDAAMRPSGPAWRILLLWAAAAALLWCARRGLGLIEGIDPSALIAFAATGSAALTAQRFAFARLAFHAIRKGRIRPRAIVTISAGPLDRDFGPCSQVTGITIDSLRDMDPATRDYVVERVRKIRPDEIRIVDREIAAIDCSDLLRALRNVPCTVRLEADQTLARLLRYPVSHVGGSYAFELQRAPLTVGDRALKRAFDLAVGAALCLCAAPLMILVGIAVRLTSPGPAIFRQTRNGIDGKPFEIYKFRTMTVQEDGACVVQAKRGDPRVTPLGRMLRRTSLDELPQLLNVLKGDMSLIGPRPHACTHDRDFALQIADYAIRQHVKPGMTGWAQVNGFRGETRTADAIVRRVEFDLRYVERWSLWFDLWILLRTLHVVLVPRNAY